MWTLSNHFLHFHSAAGDVNQDGYGDILIGYPTAGNGVAVLIFGTSLPATMTSIDIEQIILGNSTLGVAIGGTVGSSLGYSVSTAGELGVWCYDRMVV